MSSPPANDSTNVPSVPQLTLEQAETALEEAINIFEKPDNKSKLLAVVNEAKGDQMVKMMKMIPLVQEMVGGLMQEYGFDASQVMLGVHQIQMHALKKPEMQTKVAKLMAALQGNVDEEVSAEVCD